MTEDEDKVELWAIQRANKNQPISFGDWLKYVATDEEKAIVRKVGPSVFEKLERA